MARGADTLGGRIEAERKRRGWNKSDVARHFGVNQSSSSRWESNELRPGDGLVRKMADFLGVTEDELNGLRFDIVPPTVALSELKERVEQLEQSLERRMGRIEDLVLRITAAQNGAAHTERPPEFKSDAPEPAKRPSRPRRTPPTS